MRSLLLCVTVLTTLTLCLSSEPSEPRKSPFIFTDATAEVGLSTPFKTAFNHSVTWGDFDNDGRLDLFLGNFADRNVMKYGLERAPANMLLRQTTGGKFEPFPCPSVEVRSRCSGGVFVDLDNDGDLDLYTSSNRWDKPSEEKWREKERDQGNTCYRNDGGGKFVDVSATCGACPSTHYYCRDIGVFDYDNDGLLDLLVLQDTVVKRDGKSHGSRLYRNKGEFQFEDVTTKAGLPDDLWGFGIAVADLNRDRRLDFFVCGSDRLYLSQPSNTYREAESLRPVLDHKGKDLDRVTGASFGDLDNDGDLDLITGPHNYHGPSRIHVFLNDWLKNGVPQYREVTKDLGLSELPQKSPNPEIQDFDNDGILDLYWSVYFAEGNKRHPFICKGLGVKDELPRYAIPALPEFKEEGLKTNTPPAKGEGMIYYVNGSATDFDGDGDLDLCCGIWLPEPSRFFRNDTKGGNWLQVQVEGTMMNRMGVGSQVRLYRAGQAGNTSDLLSYQTISLNGGYSGSRAARVHFGLGKIETCDVEIKLPSRWDPLVLRDVKVNQLLKVKEPGGDRIAVGPTDWPWWRGPNRDGIADPQQKLPLQWSATENVLWKSPVPGRGHGSPTVVGDQIFLATAEQEKKSLSVLCYDRRSGKQLWQTTVHEGELQKGGNAKASLASSTVACDGTRLFINFLHENAVYTTALNREGKRLWQTKVSDFVNHQGFGSSPALYQSLVLVSADHKGAGVVAALERETGKFVWKVERPKLPNYASPIILNVNGRDQMLMTGCNLVSGFDPLSGKLLCEIKGSTEECVTSTVTDGRLIFTSGGYPKNHVSAVQTDGKAKVVWENNTRVYVPSMLVKDGHLYAVTDAGIAICWKSDTGKEVWKGRLGGTFSASPVLVGDTVFATNEAGKTYLFKANPMAFESMGENQLGEEVYATPTICGDRLFMRVAVKEKGQRQEVLYCIGKRE